jgi:hypothetical protein
MVPARPGACRGLGRTRRDTRSTEEIAASGVFTDVVIRRFDWEIRYTAESYIRLLETFSGNIMMEPWRRLALRPDGLVRRHWGAVLHVARKIATAE